MGKGTGILWSEECARRCTAVGVRIDNRRSCSDLYRMQMVWKERNAQGKQQRTRSPQRKEVRGSQVVQVLKAKEKGRSSGMLQRGKGTVEQHMDKSSKRHSKRER